MILTVAFIVLALWLLGIAVHITSGLIHLLLLVGIILLIAHFLRGHHHPDANR